MPTLDDRARLLHMVEAIHAVASFVIGKQRADLESDRMLVFALVRAIEIVGEAAARTTSELQSQFPEVPWTPLIGMRHRVAHGYYDINFDIVWTVATRDLVALLPQLNRIIAERGW